MGIVNLPVNRTGKIIMHRKYPERKVTFVSARNGAAPIEIDPEWNRSPV